MSCVVGNLTTRRIFAGYRAPCLNTSRKATQSWNKTRKKQRASACATNDFPSNRRDVLCADAWHLQWNLGRSRSPTICLNDISGIYGFCRHQNLFRTRVPALARYESASDRVRPRIAAPPPLSNVGVHVARRSLLSCFLPLSRFNRPCRVFNGYISRHFSDR